MLAQKKQNAQTKTGSPTSLLVGVNETQFDHDDQGTPLAPLVCSFLTYGQIGVGYISGETLILPEDVVKDTINANMNDGVLNIELPRKAPEPKNQVTKVIEIK